MKPLLLISLVNVLLVLRLFLRYILPIEVYNYLEKLSTRYLKGKFILLASKTPEKDSKYKV